MIKLKKIKSTIGSPERILRIMAALGFPKKCGVGKSVSHNLTPPIQGMINKVAHLVSIEK